MPSPLKKLISANDPGRRSRFHTARGDVVHAAEYFRLPMILGRYVAGKVANWRAEVPWIPPAALAAVAPLVRPGTRVLEIGAGMSTLWFARRGARVVSLEADLDWHASITKELQRRSCTTVDLRYVWHADAMCDYRDIPDRSLDLVFIDGGPREACLRAGITKVRPGGTVYVDNTDDPRIAGRCREDLQQCADTNGGRLDTYIGFPPGLLFVTEGMLLTVPAAL